MTETNQNPAKSQLMRKLILLLGPSGSGKDTQGNLLSVALGAPHISMGWILREQARLGNPMALEAAKITKQGKFVPGYITAELLEEQLKISARKGLILNGFPRTADQLSYFPDILNRLGLTILVVIHFTAPEDILLHRLHLQALENTAQNKDVRTDTTPEAIKERLASYYSLSKVVNTEYSSKGMLADVDATKSVSEVQQQVLEIVYGRLGLSISG